MEPQDILTVLEPTIQAFEQLGIAYYIGGSVASSAHGIFRATLDVDIVADVKPRHVRLLLFSPNEIVYNRVFLTDIGQLLLARHPLRVIVFDEENEVILQWIE